MATVQNVLDEVGYTTKKTIDADGQLTPTMCYGVLNRISDYIINLCAQNRSRLGRKVGTITTVDGTASYNDFAADLHSPARTGYVQLTSSKEDIKLITEEESREYGFTASQEEQPTAFYLDEDNNVILCPTPDAEYTVKIPYWAKRDALDSTSDTIPFNGIFDDLYTRLLTLWVQNRETYSQEFEMAWYKEIWKATIGTIEGNKKGAQLKVRQR